MNATNLSKGAFQVGTTVIYNGATIVERALQLGEPVVYVSVNYRYAELSRHMKSMFMVYRVSGAPYCNRLGDDSNHDTL